MIAVADAYVAMTSQRPHRPARSSEEALSEIRRNAGSQFDEEIVDLLAYVLEQRIERRAA